MYIWIHVIPIGYSVEYEERKISINPNWHFYHQALSYLYEVDIS